MTDQIQREILPIPNRAYAGLITYDAKDPDEGAEDADHLIGPEERLRIAMARQ